jgi:Phage derived protein Gp49-like (DUF891)
VIPWKPVENPLWRIFDWTSGANPIEEWRSGLSDDARGMFDGLLKDNRKIENPMNWLGYKRHMKGKLATERIFEFKFLADKRPYRVLCKCGEHRKHLIILIGCYHKGSYFPQNALDTAVSRSRAIGTKGVVLHEREISNDI